MKLHKLNRNLERLQLLNTDFKTLTVAYKSEVPKLLEVPLTKHTSTYRRIRTKTIPFALANKEYNRVL